MKLTLKINRYTSKSELVHLGNLFTALGLNKGASVFAPPPDEAELDYEGETTIIAASPEQEAVSPEQEAVIEPPKRRRRTKDELHVDAIVAENSRVAAAEAEAQDSNEAGLKPIEEQEQAVTQPEPAAQPEPEPEPELELEPASTPPVAPTPASLNAKATAVAKKIGPEKIKAKINELGGKLISTLEPKALIEFDSWLDAQ